MQSKSTDTKNKNQVKGALTEEILAEYYRRNGYYVVRGVEVSFNNKRVTDIDLWLYLKSSNMSQEITIVDIKNRKTPQAFERFLWTKGLQSAVSADKAIIATTETNPSILKFGSKIDVKVLDGHFLKKLPKSVDLSNRLSEEELFNRIKEKTFIKLDGDWLGKLDLCKSLFSSKITFNTINIWLEHAYYFAFQVVTRPNSKEIALRLFYRILSYICIGIDSISKDLIYDDKPTRFTKFVNGFQYGTKDNTNIREEISNAVRIIEKFGNNEDVNESLIMYNFSKAVETLNCKILAEFFSNLTNIADMYEVAFELENLSMRKEDPTTFESSIISKRMIGCLLDYWDINRSDFELVKV